MDSITIGCCIKFLLLHAVTTLELNQEWIWNSMINHIIINL
jgi:hypothetical protein